jgi:hypothetical protein
MFVFTIDKFSYSQGLLWRNLTVTRRMDVLYLPHSILTPETERRMQLILQWNVRLLSQLKIKHNTIPQPNTFTIVLSRIHAFLPALEASNAILAQRAQADPRSVDIEHVDEGMDQYIEMVCPALSFNLTSTPNYGFVRTLAWAYLKTAHTRNPYMEPPTLIQECPSPRLLLQRRQTQTPILTQHPLTKLLLRSNLSGQSSLFRDAV